MSDPITIANVDLNNISEFQRKLYDISDGDTKAKLIPRFLARFIQKPWSDHMLIKLAAVEEAGKLIFVPHMKFDFLLYCFLHLKLPTLRVKDELGDSIQIAWTRNLGHAIIRKAEMYYDNGTPQSFDHVSLDVYRQFYVKRDLREAYDRNIGNVPDLTSWSRALPGLTIKPHQPWYFAEEDYLAVPILLFNDRNDTKKTDTPIRFVYEFNLQISSLLRMRRLVPKEKIDQTKGTYEDQGRRWKDIPCRMEYLQAAPSRLPTPDIYGRHVLITPEERSWLKEHVAGEPIVQHMTDMLARDSDNTYKYGGQARLDISYSAAVRAIHVMAENMDSTRNRLLSNYTTSTTNLKRGSSPIQSTELVYFNGVRVPKTDFEFASELEPYYHCPSVPFEPGYGVLSACYGKGTCISDTSLCLKEAKAQLVVNLGQTNPFSVNEKSASTQSSKDEDEDLESRDLFETDVTETNEVEPSPNFTVHVRTVIIKKLEFSNGECTIES